MISQTLDIKVVYLRTNETASLIIHDYEIFSPNSPGYKTQQSRVMYHEIPMMLLVIFFTLL